MRWTQTPVRVVEDTYEPGSVEEAWRDYCRSHDEVPDPRSGRFEIFRSGWRRGFGQGALVSASVVVHSAKDSDDGQ